MHSQKWKVLYELNLVQGDEPKNELRSPWYMKFLMALFAVAAMGLLLYLLGDLLKTSYMSGLILGLFLLLFSYAIYLVDKSGIWEHLATALALSGEVLVVIAFDSMLKLEPWVLYLFVASIQFVLLLLMPNFILKVISATIFSVAMFELFSSMGYFYVYIILLAFTTLELWLNEFTFPKKISIVRASSYGAFFSLVYLNIVTFDTGNSSKQQLESLEFAQQLGWIDLSYTFMLFYLIWRLTKGMATLNLKFMALISLVLFVVGFLSYTTHGITLGLLLIILSYAVYNKIIMTFGIMLLAIPIFHYYYMFGTTLMDKAKLLLLIGVVIFMARWIFLKTTKGLVNA